MTLPETFAEFTSPAKCGHDGCDKRAKWTLQISIWAKGYPKSSTPITMQLSVKMCDDHQWLVTAGNFWTDEAKTMIGTVLRTMHRADPDFDGAQFMWVPLGIMPR
jgi:hypothetical protein